MDVLFSCSAAVYVGGGDRDNLVTGTGKQCVVVDHWYGFPGINEPFNVCKC